MIFIIAELKKKVLSSIIDILYIRILFLVLLVPVFKMSKLSMYLQYFLNFALGFPSDHFEYEDRSQDFILL